MPISYKNKIYTTLGTPTALSGDVVSTTTNVGVPAKDYTVKGKTVVWNQLFDKNSTPSKNSDAITYSVDGNINILSTTSAITTSYFNFLCNTIANHKYMICAKSLEWNSPNHSNLFIGSSDYPDTASYATLTSDDLAKFFTATNETCYIKAYISYSAGNYEFKMNGLQLFDLTKMFGAGNEPATAAEFRAMFPDDYYSYNAGELKTIMPTSVEASTVNLLNLGGRTEISSDRTPADAYPEIDTHVYYKGVSPNGYIKPWAVEEGVVLSSSVIVKTANSAGAAGYGIGIPLTVVPSTTYYVNYTASTSGEVTMGYANSNKIVTDYGYLSNNQFTTPADCRYALIVFRPTTPGALATFENICVSTVQTSEYQPYNKHRVNIPSSKYFPDGMRSAGSAYDEINFSSQKAIKRVGVVDMGTLNWSYLSGENGRFSANVDGIKIVPSSKKGNLVCSKYTTASIDDIWYHTADKTIGVHYDLEQVWVYDTAYTDAAAFKAAMSGVMLYYELATPAETAIAPPLQALSTFKGFTSFSAPNSLTQNGPLSVTYYAEGGANPESGWLTSYKRKLYMGRNIEWNQLLDKSKYPATTTTNGVTFTNNGDGSITVNGTAGSTANIWHRLKNDTEIPVGHKVLISGGVTGAGWSSYLFYDDADATSGIDSPGGGKIYTVTTSPVKPMIFIAEGYTVSNIIFKPQLFDLTQMFGVGKEPATPEEFWSYFPNKVYPYNAGETQPLFKISRKSQWGSATAAASAAKTITVQETSFAPAVSKLCSLRKVRGSFAGTPTLYTTANNANKIEVGNNGYEWVTKVNDDNQIVSGNDFLDAFGVSQTVDGTSLAGKTLEFMTKFSSRLSTTEGTDGGTFTSWGMSGEVEEIKSCEKEDLYCVVYNSETDTVKVYVLDEYDEQYGTFSVSAEIGYNTMIAFMLDTTEDEV